MPIIGTSGALATFKIPLVAGTNQYWILTSNANFLDLNSFTFDSSENIYTNGYSNVVTNGSITFQLNQAYGNGNVSWQKAQNVALSSGQRSTIYFDNNTQKSYEVYNQGDFSQSNAVVIINTNTGTVLSSYTDDSNIGGNTGNASIPMTRIPTDIIVDNTGNYWICGMVNERPNISTNNLKNYLNKFSSNNTKLNSVILDSAGGVTPGFFNTKTNQLLLDNAGNIIMGIPYPANTAIQSYHGVVGFDTSNANINWQILIPYPSGANATASDFFRLADRKSVV